MDRDRIDRWARGARSLALALAALLIAAPGVAADIIHYKDGRKLEGVILERSSTEVKVETSFGTIKIEMSKIARIEERLTPVQQLEQQRAQIADDDAPALFQLALWAEEQDLRKPARKLFREVVAADPDHRGANEKLGRVEVDGVWMEPDEVEKYLADMAEEMEAKGYLFHDGKWLPEAEVMKLRGFAQYKGEWLPRREAETKQALEDASTMAQVEFVALAGEHVTVFDAVLGEELVENIIYELDAEARTFCNKLELTDAEREQVLRYDVPVYIAPDQEAADRLVTSGFLERYFHPVRVKEDWPGRKAFGLHWPRPLIVLVEGDYLEARGDKDETRMGFLSHMLGNTLVERLAGGRDAPPWARAGLAAWFEGATNYFATVTITSDHVDETGAPINLWTNSWETFVEWRDNLKDPGQLANVPSLKALLRRDAPAFDSQHVGIFWSFTDFLLAKHPTEFAQYLRNYDRDRSAQERQHRLFHERAWALSFASTEDELEREWHSWAQSRPDRMPIRLLERN